NRELDAFALRGRRLHAVRRDLAAARGAVDVEVLRLAADHAVEAALDALEALGVDADEPEHVRGEASVRVEAAGLRDGVHPAQRQALDRLRLAREDVA